MDPSADRRDHVPSPPNPTLAFECCALRSDTPKRLVFFLWAMTLFRDLIARGLCRLHFFCACLSPSLFEIRSGRIVVQQVVGRNPVLGRVAGHQLPDDAVSPGISIQTDLAVDVIHLVAPGPADAGYVEARDRLLLTIIAHPAEHTQLTPT